MPRAFADSRDGKAATARLTALEADRAKAAQEKDAALQKLERSLEQSTAVLSESARGVRTKELERFRLDTQAESAFLVDSGVLAWGDPSLDVTQEILKHVENPPATK